MMYLNNDVARYRGSFFGFLKGRVLGGMTRKAEIADGGRAAAGRPERRRSQGRLPVVVRAGKLTGKTSSQDYPFRFRKGSFR